MTYTHTEAVSFIWSVADIIRDQGYQQHQYGDVILPFVVLRRLDQACISVRDKALATAEKYKARGIEGETLDKAITLAVGQPFYSVAPVTFDELTDDINNLDSNLYQLIDGFSPNVRDILKRFELDRHIAKLGEKKLLYPVVAKFTEIDLAPERVSNLDMGYIFEELIRRFSELKNEEAGHHYTPREVIRLMVDLLFAYADDLLTEPGKIITMLDPACGTGGMLSIAEERLRELNADVDFRPFGQDFDDTSYAVALSEQLMTGRQELNIALGNSLTSEDAYKGRHFDFVLANPPYGVSWKQYQDDIRKEHEREGYEGRYGAGLPRSTDGQLLFVQHMVSKMQPVTHTAKGTRIAIVMNASPLFSGDAGSGESEVRRWLIQNDLLEAVVGLPNELFYNTGIFTYVWIISNNKPPSRRGRVQLIDARQLFGKRKRSLGEKRNDLLPEDIDHIVSLYGDEAVGPLSRWMTNAEFGYQRITIQRPLRVRVSGGDEAVARLRSLPDWQNLAVRKGTADVESVRANVEAAVAQVPTEVVDTANAVASVSKCQGWGALLKKSRDAVTSALLVRDADADVLNDEKGLPVAAPALRSFESLPLGLDIDEHVREAVHPHDAAAWFEAGSDRVGYAIPFTEVFYEYKPLPSLDEVNGQLRLVGEKLVASLTGLRT